MFKSKFLANTLILSVITLGIVACSKDDPSVSNPAKDKNGESDQEKLNKEMNEAKSLLGENKPMSKADLDLKSDLISDQAGSLEATIDNTSSMTCAIIKEKDKDGYRAIFTYRGERGTEGKHSERLQFEIPMDNLASSLSVPQSILYSVEKIRRFLPDPTITVINTVDSRSLAKINVLRIENNRLAIFANLNISGSNDLGEKVSLKGDLRCTSYVPPMSALGLELDQNESFKSIDVREDIAARRAKTAEKAAQLQAEIEQNQPSIIDSLRPEIRNEYWGEKLFQLDQAARQAAQNAMEGLSNAADASGKAISSGAQQALDASADASRKAQDMVLMKTVDGIEYLASIEVVANTHSTLVDGTVDLMVAANPTRQAIVTGIVDGVIAVENASKAYYQYEMNRYNQLVNATTNGIENTVNAANAGKDLAVEGYNGLVGITSTGIEKAANGLSAGKDLAVDAYQGTVSAAATGIEKVANGLSAGKQLAVDGYQGTVSAAASGMEMTAGAVDAASNKLAEISQAVSVYWNNKLENKANLTLKIPQDNKTVTGRIMQKPEATRIMSCKVVDEAGQKRLVINTNMYRYDTSVFATVSFPVTSDLKTIADTSIRLDSLEITDVRSSSRSQVKNPNLLTPELMTPILISSETIKVGDKEVLSNNYAFFIDFKNEEGKQVILEGTVQCVLSK